VSTQLWWYVARAGGIVSWALLAASVVWGLAISSKATAGRVRPNWMLDMHRFLGGLAMIFLGVHVGGLVLDTYTHFGPTDILVPMASSWRPSAVAWGVVGLYLLAAVELTSLARKHLSKKLWRATHTLAFPLFATSTVHSLTAGSDAANPIFRGATWGTVVLVVVLTLLRVQQMMTRGQSGTVRGTTRPVSIASSTPRATTWSR
jgi:predicted ferric reductase